MKFIFCFLPAMISIAGCKDSRAEQQPGSGATVSENKNNFADTAANFPGTTIYIQLPDGFLWNETAMGFYKEEDGSVIKYDEFKTMRYAAKMPVKETMGSFVQKELITISGYKGALTTYQDGQNLTRLQLSFGDDTFKKFIEATYFSTREQTGKEIVTALRNIKVK